MDVKESKPTQGSANMTTNNWRTQDFRRKAIGEITNALKKYRPSHEVEMMNLAAKFERRVFECATSQEDYIHKISKKLYLVKPVNKDNAHCTQLLVPPCAAENHGNQGSSCPTPEQSFQNLVTSQSQERRQLSTQNALNNTAPSSAPLNYSNRQLQCQFLDQKGNVPASLQTQPASVHMSKDCHPTTYLQQQSSNMKQQPAISLQQHAVQTMPSSLLSHGSQTQPEPAVPMLESSFEAQRKQILNNFKTPLPAHSANLKLEKGEVDEDTWRHEIFQWIQTLKKFFLAEVKGFFFRLDAILRQIASNPQLQKTPDIEKRKKMHSCLKDIIGVLEIARHKIEPQFRKGIAKIEIELIAFIRHQEFKKAMPSQHNKQLLLPNIHMNALQHSSHPHNQKPLQSDHNMLQTGNMKRQYLQGQEKQQLVNQKRLRVMKNTQDPLNSLPHQDSGFNMSLSEVMSVKQEMGCTGSHIQHYSSRQHQVKLEPPSPPVSSPQLLQVPSNQSSQNPSPYKKQKKLQTFPEKFGTSGVQQANGAGPASGASVEITNPGPSPLLESSSNIDNNPGNSSECILHESNIIENPLQRLLRVVNSLSPTALRESCENLEFVGRIVERIPGSVPEVARTEYHLQAKTFSPEPLLIGGETSDARISEMESSATFSERNMIKAKSSLMEEIGMINKRLFNTVVEIENNNSATAASFSEDSQAKTVKCSFIAKATQNFISTYFSENFSPIQPLKLVIPGTYPNHSPLVLEKSPAFARDDEASSNMKNEIMSEKAMLKLKRHLRTLEQPLSIEVIVKAWDSYASSVVCEFAKQCGGGSFSSRYGVWENCAYNS